MQSILEVLECIAEARDQFDPSMLEVCSQLNDSAEALKSRHDAYSRKPVFGPV